MKHLFTGIIFCTWSAVLVASMPPTTTPASGIPPQVKSSLKKDVATSTASKEQSKTKSDTTQKNKELIEKQIGYFD